MRPWLLLLSALCLAACDDEGKPAGSDDDPGAGLLDGGSEPVPTTFSADQFVRDHDGRALILRGVNIAHTAKQAPDGLPWVDEAAVQRLRKEFGFNAIRLTVFWNHVEPERGKYAASYLDALRDILDWARDSQQFVILDMHQDLFGFVSRDEGEGDGVPMWARKADCPAFQDTEQWTDNYLTPALECQFAQFWNNERGVQDDFIAMWKHVVSELGAHPAVVGIDPFNEPWVAPRTAAETLGPFYDRLIPAVREAVPGLVVFFEPGTLSGSGVSDQSLPTPKFDNLVYAPHFYPYDLYSLRPGDSYMPSSTLETINQRQIDDVDGKLPRLIGEFGISAGVGNATQYYLDLLAAWRPDFVGFTLWSYDASDDYPYVMLDGEGNPHAHTEALFEPFAERIPGTPRSTSLDRATGTLTLELDAEKGDLVVSCAARFCMAKHDVTVQRGASAAPVAIEAAYNGVFGLLLIPLEAGADTRVTLTYAP
jgi:endoglycosylceramidase